MAKLLFALVLVVACFGCKKSKIEIADVSTQRSDENNTARVQPIISGVPDGESQLTALNLSVTGEGLVSFVYKLGLSEQTNCKIPADYSFQELEQSIELDISDLPDGDLTLCVLGQYEDESWQNYSDAKKISWFKKTGALPSVVNASTVSENQKISLIWDPPEGIVEGYLVIRSLIPVGWTPTDGEEYPLGSNDGFDVIYKGPSRLFEDESLTNYESYHYAVFSYDNLLNYSPGVRVGGIPSPDPVAWIKLREGSFVKNMVMAGTRYDGSKDLYVCRSIETDQIGKVSAFPGKFVPAAKGNPSSGTCYVPRSGKAESFEVLVGIGSSAVFDWKNIELGEQLSPSSFLAGNRLDSGLFICRFRNGEQNYYTPGYTEVSEPCTIDSYGEPDNILQNSSFEILTVLAK